VRVPRGAKLRARAKLWLPPHAERGPACATQIVQFVAGLCPPINCGLCGPRGRGALHCSDGVGECRGRRTSGSGETVRSNFFLFVKAMTSSFLPPWGGIYSISFTLSLSTLEREVSGSHAPALRASAVGRVSFTFLHFAILQFAEYASAFPDIPGPI